ncbi:hypothetical protein [Mesorhizobium sp. M1163]
MRKSLDFKFAGNQTRGDVGGDTCVELGNDEVDASIVPGSFAIRYSRPQAGKDVILEPLPNKTLAKIDENERSHHGKAFGGALGSKSPLYI